MNTCQHVIDDKIFRWRVPPGHSEEMSKTFFFWTAISKKWKLNLSEEWENYKKKSEIYLRTKY